MTGMRIEFLTGLTFYVSLADTYVLSDPDKTRQLRRVFDSAGSASLTPKGASQRPCASERICQLCLLQFRPEEFFCRPHERVRVRPDERVISTIDNNKARTRDTVVEHLRMVDRYPFII